MTEFSVSVMERAVTALVNGLEVLSRTAEADMPGVLKDLEERINALNEVLIEELHWMHGVFQALFDRPQIGGMSPDVLRRYQMIAEPATALRGIVDRLQTSSLLPIFLRGEKRTISQLIERCPEYVRELNLILVVLRNVLNSSSTDTGSEH